MSVTFVHGRVSVLRPRQGQGQGQRKGRWLQREEPVLGGPQQRQLLLVGHARRRGQNAGDILLRRPVEREAVRRVRRRARGRGRRTRGVGAELLLTEIGHLLQRAVGPRWAGVPLLDEVGRVGGRLHQRPRSPRRRHGQHSAIYQDFAAPGRAR